MESFLLPKHVKIAVFFLFCKNEDKEIIPKIKFIPIKAMPENTRSAFENEEINVM